MTLCLDEEEFVMVGAPPEESTTSVGEDSTDGVTKPTDDSVSTVVLKYHGFMQHFSCKLL